ncbi:MAG: hypothetical protein R2737_01655 [Candidatus Nanopelagicales bacterium]
MTVTAATLEGALARARADLQASAGGAAVCTFTRAGIPVPSVKLHEGAWAALSEVRRQGRRGRDPLEQVAQDVRSRWAADLELRRQRDAGPDWVAYLLGGVEALDRLLDPDSP